NVNLGAGTSIGNGIDSVTAFENVLGSAFNDQLVGDSNANRLMGADGNDVLAGRLGDDILDGGTGTNAADYRTANGPMTINLQSGQAFGASSTVTEGLHTRVNINNVLASNYEHETEANRAKNVIKGEGRKHRTKGT